MGIDFRRPRHIRGFRFGEVLIFDPGKALVEKTASGSIAHISDGADTVPIKSLIVTIPASLSGVSAVTEKQTGRNLVDGTNFTRGLPSTTIGASIETISSSTRYAYFGASIKGGNYTVSSVSNDTDYYNAILIFGYTNGELSFYTNASVNASKTVDLSACDYARIAIGSRTTLITVPTDFTDYGTIQLEYGSTAHAYEPYIAPTVSTVNLGRTIYGGTADVVNGQGESSYKIITVGNSGWNYYSAGGYIYRDFSDKVIPEIGDSDHVLVTDNPDMPYGGVNYASQFQDLHIYQAHNPAIYIKDTSCTSLKEFYTKYSNMKIGYELATPTDFTFTPITPTPETALGVNNFWADEGDSEVTYYAYAE